MINYLTKERAGRLVLWAAACFTAAFLIRNPLPFAEAFGGALRLCLTKVAPPLFPVLALTNILIESGFMAELGKLFEKPSAFLFGLPGACAPAVALGMTAGFPVGAKCAVSLYSSRQCTKDEAERLLAFANNASPAFLIAAGAGLFGDAKVGAVLYAAQIAAAVAVGAATGILARRRERLAKVPAVRNENGMSSAARRDEPGKRGATKSAARRERGTAPAAPPYAEKGVMAVIASSVAAAASSLITVCALVCFFSVFTRLIGMVFNLDGGALAFVSGLLEITSGLNAASEAGGGVIAAAFIVGWSGMSVHSQAAAFASPAGLSMKRYFIGKAVQAALCAAIAAVWVWFL